MDNTNASESLNRLRVAGRANVRRSTRVAKSRGGVFFEVNSEVEKDVTITGPSVPKCDFRPLAPTGVIPIDCEVVVPDVGGCSSNNIEEVIPPISQSGDWKPWWYQERPPCVSSRGAKLGSKLRTLRKSRAFKKVFRPRAIHFESLRKKEEEGVSTTRPSGKVEQKRRCGTKKLSMDEAELLSLKKKLEGELAFTRYCKQREEFMKNSE